MARKWTKEQKDAARARMRLVQTKRWAEKRIVDATPTEGEKAVDSSPNLSSHDIPTARPPEVQAVIDTMDPQRKAKMMMAQRRVWQDNGRADGKAAQEALQRFEAEKQGTVVITPPVTQTVASNAVIPDAFNQMAAQSAPQRDPGRIGSREVSLIVRTDGTMVSQYGPCVCGRPKREWHAICCKP